MRVVPRRAVENIICAVVVAEIGKRDTLQIERLRIGGVLVTAAQAFDRAVAVFHTVLKSAVFQRKPAHGGVAADVAGVAAKALKIILLRLVVMLLVLLQMQTVDVQLLDRGIFRGPLYWFADRNGLLLVAPIRRVGDKLLSICAQQRSPDAVNVRNVRRDRFLIDLFR